MSDYSFAKVEQEISLKTTLPSGCVSISKTGRIGLSSEFADEYGTSVDSRASLYWDDSSKAIAISFNSDGRKSTPGSFAKVQSTDGYRVAPVGRGSAAYIVAAGFFKKVDIDPSEHQGFYRYEVLDADDAGITDGGKTVFIVELDSGNQPN